MRPNWRSISHLITNSECTQLQFLSCEMQSCKKSNCLILIVCHCIPYFSTCLLFLGVTTHLSLIDLYPWSPSPSWLLRDISSQNNWPLVYGLHIPKSSFNDPCLREWNIMIISKIQVWWVIDWTSLWFYRSQTRSSCAAIEGPKHFARVKQNCVHKPADEQTFVVFNM